MSKRTLRLASRNTRSTPVGGGHTPVTPTSFASLENLWDAADYNSGSQPAASGSRANTLTANSGSPTRNASVVAFNGRPTVVLDGVDDSLRYSGQAITDGNNTIAWVGRFTSTGYAIGYYSNGLGYQFIVPNTSTDTLGSDPSALSVRPGALSSVAFWAVRSDGRVYKNGRLVGSLAFGRGGTSSNTFYIGSAGGAPFGGIEYSEVMVFGEHLTSTNISDLFADYIVPRYGNLAAYVTRRDVWMLWGDSEMAGTNDPATGLPVGYPPADGTLWMLRSNAAWAELAEPCADGSYPPVGSGPGGLFAWYARAAHGDGRQVAVVNMAVGSTFSSQWLPSSDPASLYQKCLQKTLNAFATPGTFFKGMLIYIGANDATLASPDFAANITSTLTSLRTGLDAHATNQVELMGQLPTTVPSDTSYPSWSAVRTAIASMASARTLIVPQVEGPWREGYNLHLAPAANIVWARDNALPLYQAHVSYAA